jgi:thioredoxin reductase (NADPH)
LVVGASYVALECAGFLAGCGFDTTVMARSIFLRGFDQQCAEAIAEYMGNHGTKFIRPAIPTKIEKVEDENSPNNGKLLVSYTMSETGETRQEVFDTVLLAIGRRPETDLLGLDKAKVSYDINDGKIPVINERTNVPHIYAIGDCIKGELELTPVAIMAGRLLARRLYRKATLLMDYVNIPTTVFTPIEYGCVGYTEENAEKLFGKQNIEVYHSYFTPLEWTVSHREENICYIKCIVNKLQNERVIGLHVLGPNAGEIIQGFAAAVKCGITKAILDNTVGIHPTCAEEVCGLTITKSSGVEAKKKGC